MERWGWRQDLNPQPTAYKAVALPIVLRQHLQQLIASQKGHPVPQPCVLDAVVPPAIYIGS